MGKALLLGILAAAVAGGLVGFLNKFVGGPAWLVGGVAGLAGALACGMAVRNYQGK